MSETFSLNEPATVVARVAAEDLQPKDMVTVLNEVIEFPSFLWCCSNSMTSAEDLVRLRFMARDAGKPYKVRGVCLPFVYATDADGKLVIFDTRQHQLVRLDPKVARKAWKRMRRAV